MASTPSDSGGQANQQHFWQRLSRASQGWLPGWGSVSCCYSVGGGCSQHSTLVETLSPSQKIRHLNQTAKQEVVVAQPELACASWGWDKALIRWVSSFLGRGGPLSPHLEAYLIPNCTCGSSGCWLESTPQAEALVASLSAGGSQGAWLPVTPALRSSGQPAGVGARGAPFPSGGGCRSFMQSSLWVLPSPRCLSLLSWHLDPHTKVVLPETL